MAFRELLETIQPRKMSGFGGNYLESGIQEAIDKSPKLLKNHYFKQINVVSTLGRGTMWVLHFDRDTALETRNEIFREIKLEFLKDKSLRSTGTEKTLGYDWQRRDHVLAPPMQKYRELEHARFMD